MYISDVDKFVGMYILLCLPLFLSLFWCIHYSMIQRIGIWLLMIAYSVAMFVYFVLQKGQNISGFDKLGGG